MVLNPKMMSRFVIVNKDSAGPCRKSTLASVSPYCTLATIPAGIVAKTKASKNWKPKLAAGGVFVGLRLKKTQGTEREMLQIDY